MRSLKRLGAAFFATSMLCTINVVNAKIFVGTSQVAESVNIIDKDLIESQNNELIAGKANRVMIVRIGGERIKFIYDSKSKVLELQIQNSGNCNFSVNKFRDLEEGVIGCLGRNAIDARPTEIDMALVNLREIIFR